MITIRIIKKLSETFYIDMEISVENTEISKHPKVKELLSQ